MITKKYQHFGLRIKMRDNSWISGDCKKDLKYSKRIYYSQNVVCQSKSYKYERAAASSILSIYQIKVPFFFFPPILFTAKCTNQEATSLAFTQKCNWLQCSHQSTTIELTSDKGKLILTSNHIWSQRSTEMHLNYCDW